MLNWIYVDKDTYELKYGVRADAQPHITGPFDCTRQDRRMTLEKWEGFVAVEEFPGIWALYFDRDDDGLVTKVPMGTRVLEVELTRREKKERKPEPDPNQPQTLDEKMKQHKEQTQREEEERQEMLNQQQQAEAEAQPTPTAESQEQQNEADPSLSQTAEIEDRTLNLDKLKLQPETLAAQPSGAFLHSPSVATDNVSFWSAARKADGLSDTASVTAASSIADRLDILDEANGEVGENAGGYMKPYVEDDPTPEREVDDVNNST